MALRLLTQIQSLAEGPEALEHSQLQFEGQSVAVDRPGMGAGRGLGDKGGSQLWQDIFGEAAP